MNNVSWHLVDDAAEEIIASRDDIIDVIEIRENIDQETRITDTPNENYDKRNRSNDGRNWGQVSSL
jgi:hypothetical protein